MSGVASNPKVKQAQLRWRKVELILEKQEGEKKNNSEPIQTSGLPELYTCIPTTAMFHTCSFKTQILQKKRLNTFNSHQRTS